MTMYEILTFNMKEHSTASNGQRQSDYHRDPVAVVDNGPVSAASVQSGPGYSYPGGTDAANDTGTISRFTMGPYARSVGAWLPMADCGHFAPSGSPTQRVRQCFFRPRLASSRSLVFLL
jgi:hypothetical protein